MTNAGEIAQAIKNGDVTELVQDWGRVNGGANSPDAFVDVRLPNGQTFRIKIEETW